MTRFSAPLPAEVKVFPELLRAQVRPEPFVARVVALGIVGVPLHLYVEDVHSSPSQYATDSPR